MDALDPLHAPLKGVNLIEASAGTGKTYAITALYLRLLLESDLTVEKILVVTYTKAATAELRDRVRRRLVEVRCALERGDSKDPIAERIIRSGDPRPAVRRLTRAILGLDRAAIFTIHGFCQRALADHAFESGIPFETEMITDQWDLLMEVVDDFWRQESVRFSSGFAGHLSGLGIGPDLLARRVARLLGRPCLEIRTGTPPGDMGSVENAYLAFIGWRTLSG